MKIASWNVNSLRARMEHVLAWLEAQRPDVLALQGEADKAKHRFVPPSDHTGTYGLAMLQGRRVEDPA